jgi:hypothetical protein
MDTLVSGVILLAVGGLATLAYRHPKTYQIYFRSPMRVLYGLAPIVFISMGAGARLLMEGLQSISPPIDRAVIDQAIRASFPPAWVVIAGWLAVIAFIELLGGLEYMLKSDEQKRD